MNIWEMLAILAASAFGIGHLAKTSADQGSPSVPGSTDAVLLERAVRAALSREQDYRVLQQFYTKLQNAGYTEEANAIGARLDEIMTLQERQQSVANASRTVLTYQEFHPQ